MQKVQKVNEYQAFLKLLKEGQFETWEVIAEAVGVHRNTIMDWKKLPEAQKAIVDGIQLAIKKMETAGKKDWKMWREKLKLLGVRDKEAPLVAQQFNIDKFNILDGGEENYDELRQNS